MGLLRNWKIKRLVKSLRDADPAEPCWHSEQGTRGARGVRQWRLTLGSEMTEMFKAMGYVER